MAEVANHLNDAIRALKRRRWQILVPAALIFLSVLAFSFTLPSIYRSTGAMLIEQREIPVALSQSTVKRHAGERVRMLGQKVMTTENLSRIIEKYGLYDRIRETLDIVHAANRMRRDIALTTISANVATGAGGSPQKIAIEVSLSFDHANPATAQGVAHDLLELFIEENRRDRQETARRTSVFLEQEAGKLALEMAALETQLATFKETHHLHLPEMMNFHLDRLKRIEERLIDQEQAIRSLEQQRGTLQSELAATQPYLQLQARIAAIDAELRTARIDREELLESRRDHEQRIADAPRIERDYQTLLRDHRTVQANHQDMLTKLSDARMAEILETETQGDRFFLVEPPHLPGRPYRPNRLGWLLTGFVLAIGGGMGHAMVRAALDPRIYGANAVFAVTGARPLGLIPPITSATLGVKRNHRARYAVLVFSVIVLLGAVAVIHVSRIFTGY